MTNFRIWLVSYGKLFTEPFFFLNIMLHVHFKGFCNGFLNWSPYFHSCLLLVSQCDPVTM